MKTPFLILFFAAVAVAQETPTHKFFDGSNVTLFTMHAATTAWDAAETHQGVNQKICTFGYSAGNQVVGCGRYENDYREANPLARPFVHTTTGQVLFFGGTVAANMTAACPLLRAEPHKMERMVSALNIGFSIRGASSWPLHRPRAVPPPATCVTT